MALLRLCKWFYACLIMATAPAIVYGQDTVKTPVNSDAQTIEYNYQTHQLSQPLPIDRPFNVLVTHIPAAFKELQMYVQQLEPRRRRNGARIRKGIIEQAEYDSLKFIREIYCGKQDITADSAYFFVPVNLIPNRDFCIVLNNYSVSPLSDEQKKELSDFLKDKFKNDETLKNIINQQLNKRYINPAGSYSTVSITQQQTTAYIKHLIKQIDPNYDYRTNEVADINNMGSLYDAVSNIKNRVIVHDRIIKDSSTEQQKANAMQAFENMDWVGASVNEQNFNTYVQKLHTPMAIKFKSDVDSAGNMQILLSNDSQAQESFEDVKKYINHLLDIVVDSAIVAHTYNSVGGAPTYYVDITKNASRNVTIDIGGAYSWSMDKIFLYSAVNVYFRGIDKNLPLWNTNYSVWDFIASRTSLVVGITLTPVDKANERKGIAGNKGLVLGGGFRLLPWMKVSTGSLIYYASNTNPLAGNESYHTKFSPFAALSIDIDVKTIFKGLPLIDDAVFK